MIQNESNEDFILETGEVFKGNEDINQSCVGTVTQEIENPLIEILILLTEPYQYEHIITKYKENYNYFEEKKRLPYSEITKYVYEMGLKEKRDLKQNLKTFLSDLAKNNYDDDKLIKVVDHANLALIQAKYILNDESKTTYKQELDTIKIALNEKIDSVNNDLIKKIKDEETTFSNKIIEAERKIQDVQKDYITILGIFASIVLAFVGGAIFSTSVLQNIHQVSIFRLLLVVDFIGFILINLISLLTDFIFKINDKDNPFEAKMDKINNILIGIAIFIVVIWLYRFQIINKVI